MRGFALLRLLWTLSVRSLVSHKVKSLIVGSIMAFGTFLVVLGTALTDSIERSMANSITGSIAGHLQVYSKDAKDPLAMFGSGFMGAEDVGRIDDFSQLQAALQDVPGIKAVVPMGLDFASIASPGELERVLGAVRKAIRDGDTSRLPEQRAQIREILEQMKDERTRRAVITADKEKTKAAEEILANVTTEEFWQGFDRDPLAALEVLDTKVAPLAEEGKLLYFRYLGTDIPAFEKNFDRFQVVDGEPIPANQRGFLLNKKFYEEFVKNVVAKNIDRINREITEKGLTIAGDPTLQALVRQTSRQYRKLTYHLDADESKVLEGELKALLPDVEGGLPELMTAFLTFTDENFRARFDFFYAHIATKVDLYAVHVGDTVAITAFTRSGFMKSVNVRVYGTFNFKGLDRSDLAGAYSLMDLVTFRELYGLMSADKREELAGIKTEIGIKDVGHDDAEAALFGGDDAKPVEAKVAAGFDEFAGVDLGAERERMKALQAAGFNQADIDKGLALDAAIVLDDPRTLVPTKKAVEAAIEKAGLNLQVVDWQSAAGIIGQFILVIRGVLYVAIFIIFLVALVIINNSMVMATMERTMEIGTMRAIGAQRSMVLAIFLVETTVLGIVSGGIGATAGGSFVKFLGSVGLAAPNPQLIFMFGGPRLFPTLGPSNLLFGALIILFVSIASTFYPAFIAAKIQPVVAMRQKE